MKISGWPCYVNESENPYNAMIYRELASSGASIKEGTWYKPDLFVDLFHMHWPDAIFSSKKKYLVPVKFLVLFINLMVMRFFGVKIVWTVHNTTPHSSFLSLFHNFVYKILFKLSDGLIFLNEESRSSVVSDFDLNLPTCVIKHPAYTKYYHSITSDIERTENTNLELLAFGQIRINKNIEKCIKVIQFPEVGLTIAGRVKEKEAEALIYEEIGKCEKNNLKKLKLKFGWLRDEELIKQIIQSDAVLLPYGEITNSGVLFLALSLGTRVIAQRNEYFKIMASEFSGGVLLVDFNDEIELSDVISQVNRFETDFFIGNEYNIEAVSQHHMFFFSELLQ